MRETLTKYLAKRQKKSRISKALLAFVLPGIVLIWSLGWILYWVGQ
jgi:chromate transport protein ChrA